MIGGGGVTGRNSRARLLDSWLALTLTRPLGHDVGPGPL